MSAFKVIVATDQSLLRDLLALAIRSDGRFSLAGQADDALAAARVCRRREADVLLLDLDNFQWENIGVLTKALKRRRSGNVLGLTGRNDPFSVQRSIEAGFFGVFEKDESLSGLLDALAAVGRGERFFSDGASKTRAEIIEDPRSFPKMLTPREQEIVSLVGNCYTSREIATKLGLSARTVETHRYNIMKKLQIRDAPGLIRYAVENGLDQLIEDVGEAVGQ